MSSPAVHSARLAAKLARQRKRQNDRMAKRAILQRFAPVMVAAEAR